MGSLVIVHFEVQFSLLASLFILFLVPTHTLTPERKLVTLESLSPVTISDSVDSASPAPADSARGEFKRATVDNGYFLVK